LAVAIAAGEVDPTKIILVSVAAVGIAMETRFNSSLDSVLVLP
jgi:hypothetical protein